MDTFTLQQLSLILDQELVILPENFQRNQLQEKIPADSPQAEPAVRTTVQESPSLYQSGGDAGNEQLKINYEGNFEKGVLVVYQGSGLEPASREFLMKILGAVGCSLKDVALLPGSQLEESGKESFNHLNPLKCLVFGRIQHPLMQLKQTNYEIISGETLFLFADDLNEIDASVPLKKKLWTKLQILFNINK